jgi:hypothetical protein
MLDRLRFWGGWALTAAMFAAAVGIIVGMGE